MAGETGIGIDFSRYAEHKAKGCLTLQPAGKTSTRAVMFKQKFDSDTRDELDPQMISVNPKDLHASIAAFQAQIDGMNEMLKDLGELGIDVSPPAPPGQK
jgi:hypothetical protein